MAVTDWYAIQMSTSCPWVSSKAYLAYAYCVPTLLQKSWEPITIHSTHYSTLIIMHSLHQLIGTIDILAIMALLTIAYSVRMQ